MKNKYLIWSARALSIIFTPFYLPLVGVVALFLFSYLKMMPWQYQLLVIIIVYLFTILLPTFLIRLYRNMRGWTRRELSWRDRRGVPYLISIGCYFACCYILYAVRAARLVEEVVIVAGAIQLVCAFLNVFWKVSIHSAAIGGITGSLVAFAFIFSFNPVWWLCLLLIISGLVGTSRMILRQHRLNEVLFGFLIGFVIAFFIII